jgi:hypothetical protein
VPARGVDWIFPAVRRLCVLFALFPTPLTGQAKASVGAAKMPPDDFRQTVRQSGLIFEGTVTAIQCERAKGQSPQSYRISFQVKQGLRGVRSGATVTIREWAGLWAVGPAQGPRYHVGERAFLFLYPPSRAGLTSTVGGRKGKLAVNAGQVLLPRDWAENLGEGLVSAAKLSSPKPVRVPVPWLVQRVERAGGE